MARVFLCIQNILTLFWLTGRLGNVRIFKRLERDEDKLSSPHFASPYMTYLAYNWRYNLVPRALLFLNGKIQPKLHANFFVTNQSAKMLIKISIRVSQQQKIVKNGWSYL